MQLTFDRTIRHFFILGAGSSVEYGLPVWKDLSKQIKERANNDDSLQYKTQILNWMDKIGEKKLYATLDECIAKEAASKDHHVDGLDIEDKIFSIILQIFNDSYHQNPDGWINKLNRKILNNKDLQNQLAFINYNYDHVLDDNFLNYEYLPTKHKRLNFKSELKILLSAYNSVLCPHGTFNVPKLSHTPRIKKFFDTIKTGDGDLLDVVSCYESKQHSLTFNSYTTSPRSLYILGLGGGLKINMKNLKFELPIGEVHVTIRSKENLNDTVSFLAKKFSKQESEIKIYETCSEIIENCF